METTRRGSWVLILALAALPAGARAQGGAEEMPPEAPPTAAIPDPMGEAQPVAADLEPSGSVTRASFTTAVVEREPQDSLEQMTNDVDQVVFFTEFQDFQGETLTHVWKLDGQEMARVPFDVDGPRWRVYSTKNLDPSWLGDWEVTVEDSSGRVLQRRRFSYLPAPEPSMAQPSDAPAGTPESFREQDAPLPASIDLE
jgi:hypothetical protein